MPRLKRASKPRRVLLFVLAVVLLGGLNAFGTLLGRPIPLWFNLGGLALSGWVCWHGWEDDDTEPPPAWATSPAMQRLGHAATLVAGAGLCWLGWLGWHARGDGSFLGLAVVLGPVGLLCLLWELGTLVAALMRDR